MESGSPQARSPGGHPRLLRCEVANSANEQSLRYVELEQFRLWEYMMRNRHDFSVQKLQLGLWMAISEFEANPGPFQHGGQVEEVSCITISWFNSSHNYTLDIMRYVPTEQCETVRQILLSHIAASKRGGRSIDLSEQHGVCISRRIEDPEVELILGLSDMEVST